MPLDPLDTLSLTRNDSLFLDLDGTMAEIGPDPDAIGIDAETTGALRVLAEKLDGAMVFLSGRDVRDLASRTPDFAWRAGGHGLEIVAPGAEVPERPGPLPDEVLAPLRAIEEVDGVWLELKGPVAALHYRAAPDRGDACIAAAERAAGLGTDLVFQPGKMVVEVKPAHAHKGVALRTISGKPEFAGRRAIMAGDDTTDEDAIRVARELGGLGIKVGDGETAATYHAPDPAAFRAWLRREAERLA
ncbi:trehalose-phosphatase [Amaricoccus macauensis]|uniref:trehalose-phosphatase n=1 Tax=Amaricoccus macauensis TaxID=57001 RepID=UPI003C7B9307